MNCGINIFSTGKFNVHLFQMNVSIGALCIFFVVSHIKRDCFLVGNHFLVQSIVQKFVQPF